MAKFQRRWEIYCQDTLHFGRRWVVSICNLMILNRSSQRVRKDTNNKDISLLLLPNCKLPLQYSFKTSRNLTVGVPLASWVHVDSCSGHSNQLMTNKLDLSQPPTLSFPDTNFNTFSTLKENKRLNTGWRFSTVYGNLGRTLTHRYTFTQSLHLEYHKKPKMAKITGNYSLNC